MSTASVISRTAPGAPSALKHSLVNGGTGSRRLVGVFVSCDYLYITQSGIFGCEELSEDEREGSSRVLVMYRGSSHAPFAIGAPRKGADSQGHVVECICQNVRWLGHSRVTIRSDNEPALVQVV